MFGLNSKDFMLMHSFCFFVSVFACTSTTSRIFFNNIHFLFLIILNMDENGADCSDTDLFVMVSMN